MFQCMQQEQELSAYLDEEAEGRHQCKAACSKIGQGGTGMKTSTQLKRAFRVANCNT